MRAVPDRGPRSHQDGQPGSRQRGRAAVLHRHRHEPRAERRAQRLGHGHAPFQVEFVTDDRGICYRGTGGHSHLHFGKILNGATSTVVIKVQRQGRHGLECGHAIGITNSAKWRAQGAGSRTPRTTRRPLRRSWTNCPMRRSPRSASQTSRTSSRLEWRRSARSTWTTSAHQMRATSSSATGSSPDQPRSRSLASLRPAARVRRRPAPRRRSAPPPAPRSPVTTRSCRPERGHDQGHVRRRRYDGRRRHRDCGERYARPEYLQQHRGGTRELPRERRPEPHEDGASDGRCGHELQLQLHRSQCRSLPGRERGAEGHSACRNLDRVGDAGARQHLHARRAG